MTFWSDAEDDDEDYYSEEDNRMKELVDMWWNGNTIIGRIFRFVYDKTSVSETELKSFINSIGSANSQELFNELVRKQRGHSLVFMRDIHKNTRINTETREYVLSL